MEIEVLTFALVVAGDVETFDQVAFKANLAKEMGNGVVAADIVLIVTAASVTVVAEVRAPADATAKAAAFTKLRAIASDPATASSALGVTVERITSAPVASKVVESADRQGAQGGGGTLAVVLGAVGAVVAICLIGGLVLKYRTCKRKSSQGDTPTPTLQHSWA